LEKELTDLCSLWVRKKAGGRCEYHERLWRAYAERRVLPSAAYIGCDPVIQGCHKITRSNKRLKFDERNLFAGCSGSNCFFGRNPRGKEIWGTVWRELWPEDVAYLERVKGQIAHYNRGDLALMIYDFKRKLSQSAMSKEGT